MDDQALRDAAGCPQCVILNRAESNLDQLGVSIVSAKLSDGYDVIDIAIDPGGRKVDKLALLKEEESASLRRYGKRTKELS